MTQIFSHPSAARLAAFLGGRLPRGDHDAVERHVAECASCLGVMSRVPDDPLARLAREAAQRVAVDEPTPIPGSLKFD